MVRVACVGFSEVKRINDKFICLEPIISEKTEGRAGDSETTSFWYSVWTIKVG